MDTTSLLGMPVFAVDAGRKLGIVERLLFSIEEKRVVALALTPGASQLQPLLPVGKILSIGHDAITVASEADTEATVENQVPARVVGFDQIEKERVITESGEDLGGVSSLHFDESDFRLMHLELGRGFLSSTFRVSVHDIVSVGEDVIVVRDTIVSRGEMPPEPPVADGERDGRERLEPGLA